MKVLILGDAHFGMRGDHMAFHDHYKKFYQEVMFPYMERHNITEIYQLGDLFDRRKFINFNTLALSKRYFFDYMKKNGIKFHTLLGNHDIFFRSTLDVNSPMLTLGEYDNITVYDKPTKVQLGEFEVDIIPWICRENEVEVAEFIKESKAQICLGHFEIAGFAMYRGAPSHEGMDRKILEKYKLVLSGHFHTRSMQDNIIYVGTPGEMTWSDYNDKRGFAVLDTETGDLQFVDNPNRMFVKITYDDTVDTFETLQNKDYSIYKDVFVKVVVNKKENQFLFDYLLDNLYKASPLEVSIVEDFTDYSTTSDEDIIDQAEDTVTILDKYIESLSLPVDSLKLKVMFRDIHNEALKMETTSTE